MLFFRLHTYYVIITFSKIYKENYDSSLKISQILFGSKYSLHCFSYSSWAPTTSPHNLTTVVYLNFKYPFSITHVFLVLLSRYFTEIPVESMSNYQWKSWGIGRLFHLCVGRALLRSPILKRQVVSYFQKWFS